jgi:predicted RNA-binding protein associated with RNAse of E/G family
LRAQVTRIRLVYRRPPDRTDVFDQRLLAVDNGCHVTLLEHMELSRPMVRGDTTVLENGAPIIWFTFEGAWHDIGRFHNAAGEFTGYYANAIRPVSIVDANNWECTDLFLDVWLGASSGTPELLDEDELDNALRNGWIDSADGRRARAEAEQIMAAASIGAWPPRIAREWTISRVREQ